LVFSESATSETDGGSPKKTSSKKKTKRKKVKKTKPVRSDNVKRPAQPEASNVVQPETSDSRPEAADSQQPDDQQQCAEGTDYGPRIATLDTQMQSLLDSLNLQQIEGYGVEILTVKEAMGRLSAKLETFLIEQSANERTADLTVSALAESVKSLRESVDAVDKAHQSTAETAKDASTSHQAMAQRVVSLEGRLEQQIEAHSQKLDAVHAVAKSASSVAKSASSDKGTKALERQIAALETKVLRFERQSKKINDRLAAVETNIAEQNKKIERVHDSTAGAIAHRLLRKTLDSVADVGEITVSVAQSVVDRARAIDWRAHSEHFQATAAEIAQHGLAVAKQNGARLTAKVQEVDWKGYYEAAVAAMVHYGDCLAKKVQDIDWMAYYRAVTDPAVYASIVDGLRGMWRFVDNWWMNAAQPTIARQWTTLSAQTTIMAQDAVEFIHSHLLYRAMVRQLTPYLKMANVPVEYSGFAVDGLLVVFVFSGLWTLTMIMGMCCDCCCPMKRTETDSKPIAPATAKTAKSLGNGVSAPKTEKKGKSPKRAKKRRSSSTH